MSENITDGIDLSNLWAPVVVLDTNIIRGASEQSTPFQILRELAQANAVKVVIPTIVLEERRTQWRARYAKNVDAAKKALSIIVGELDLANPEQLVAGQKALDELDIEVMSIKRYEDFLSKNGFQVRELSIDECNTAWAGSRKSHRI